MWFPLKSCESSHSSPALSPVVCSSRRLSKAYSHEYRADDAVDSPDRSSSSSLSILPRSRSAESNLLLQPEIVCGGLSAPASLAPSRRGSSYSEAVNELPVHSGLGFPQSNPSSRRGSAVFDDDDDDADPLRNAASLKVDPAAVRSGRSQSFRLSPSKGSAAPAKRSYKKIVNTASLELGPGQVLPPSFTDLANKFAASNQIKLGLVVTKGQLEVDVIAVRNIPLAEDNTVLDTFVKVNFASANSLDFYFLFKKKKKIILFYFLHF